MLTKPMAGRFALVCGAGGFIGHHLVRRLKREGFWVRGTDLKFPRFSETEADDFMIGDLRDPYFVRQVIDRRFDEIYQLAADMGGAGYIFTGEHDADVMHNSASVNLNVLHAAYSRNNRRIFYSSSACMYPEYNQLDPDNPNCAESSAYPAAPDSEYGWEKLFSERLYLAYGRNHGMDVRIARYHNIFGPEGSWNDGREKAPAAVCRKVAMASNGGEVEIWGDGKQTRSFLYIDELVDIVAGIGGKSLKKRHIDGPTGVRGRNSDNRLIREKLNWSPSTILVDGLRPTYAWISSQVMRNARSDGEALRVSTAASKPTSIRAVS